MPQTATGRKKGKITKRNDFRPKYLHILNADIAAVTLKLPKYLKSSVVKKFNIISRTQDKASVLL